VCVPNSLASARSFSLQLLQLGPQETTRLSSALFPIASYDGVVSRELPSGVPLQQVHLWVEEPAHLLPGNVSLGRGRGELTILEVVW
jgi:hypothetical protein